MLEACLSGLRVLDLSLFIPGPFATQWLADLGASVIKVESPAGDPLRTMGPLDADGVTAFYKLANRNKSVVTLDLKSPQGQHDFTSLLLQADVLVEGFRPGVLDRLGFGAAKLAELNPRLIHCALSGYGQTGDFAPSAGHDLTYMALSGGLWGNGPADRPVMTFPPMADGMGAMAVVVAVLAALVRRDICGKGANLDVSLAEAALGWMGGTLTIAHRWGDEARESGLINGGAAYYRIYETADGEFMAVAPLEEKFWQIFCTAVGRPDWIARQADPMPQHDLIAEMTALFKTRSRDAWTALLRPLDCCCEPVLRPSEALTLPHWQERGLIRIDRDQDQLAEVVLPILLNGRPVPDRRPLQFMDAAQARGLWA